MVRRFLYLALISIIIGCEKVDLAGFFVSPGDNVDKRFEQSMKYTDGMPYDIVETDDEYIAYICTDVHLDRTQVNLDRFLSDLRNDDNSSFGIVLGDAIDRKGKMHAFSAALEWDRTLQKHERPVFVIPGNHDMFFGQWEDFRKFFGASVYYVEIKSPAGTDIIIALDSASGTHGRRQIEWLRDLLKSSRHAYRHCIIVTHTNIFKTDNSQFASGNLPLEETLELTELFDKYNVDLVFQGHDHYHEDIVYKGVRYTIVGTIKDTADSPEYLKLHTSPEGFEYEWVKL